VRCLGTKNQNAQIPPASVNRSSSEFNHKTGDICRLFGLLRHQYSFISSIWAANGKSVAIFPKIIGDKGQNSPFM